jgi:Mrp family chromosome partitioning ATPase
MNKADPGSDFVLSAISRARAERAARPQDERRPAPTEPAARSEHWAALHAFTPDQRHLERHHINTLRHTQAARPFDMIRTKLLRQMHHNGWRRVALTSPGSGCGKTMLTLNLALSIARQRELAAMAVELDMRRPAMARALGLTAGHQFAQVLAGRAAAVDHIARIGANLAVATNHRPEPAAAELLASKDAGRALDLVEADFAPDVMLLDLPPMLMTDDAMAFMDQIDCVLLVAAAGQSTTAEITRCAEELAAHCNFLGVILNKCRFMPAEDKYGYGDYGYGHET